MTAKPRAPARPGAKRGTYHHGDLPRALMNASLALIETKGSGGFTLREVARRAGVSHAAPYRHFRDRNALLAAVAEEGFRTFHARLVASSGDAAAGGPVQQLVAIGVAYVRFASDHPSHFRVMFGPDVDPASYPSLQHEAAQSFAVLVDVIARGQAARAFRSGPPVELAIGAWSLVHGLASLAIDKHIAFADPAPIEDVARRVIGDYVDALRP